MQAAIGEDLVIIFILPPSMAELERRLRERGTDSEEVIARPMRRAAGEIEHWAEYDYVLVNDDMDRMPRRGAGDRRGRTAQAAAARSTSCRFVRDLVGRALSFEQFQEARGGEEIAAAVLQRRLGLGIRSPLLELPAVVDADRLPRLAPA